jgi:hypothetical protein
MRKPENDLWTFLKRELTPYKTECTKIHLHHFVYRTDGGKFMLFDKHLTVTGVPENWKLEVMELQGNRLETLDEFIELTNDQLIDKLKELAHEFAITESQKSYTEHLLLR